MLYAIIGMLVIILDQGVKYWVTSNLMVDSVTQPLIPGVLSLVRLHNDGAAFSFLAGGGARIYFIILTAIFTVAVIIALATNFINGRFGRWCLVLVTAGGLSNCLDRMLYGYVVDMFKVDLFDFAVFNVADVFITIFAILFIVYIIFGGEDKHEEDDDFAEDDEEGTSHEPLNVSFKKLRNSAENEREERRARNARERATEVKTNKYREEADEVSSPRFNRGNNVNSAAARQTGAKQRVDDNSPAARRERALEGFGHQTASTGNARATTARPATQAQTERRAKPQKTLYEQDYEQYKAEHPELEDNPPVRKKATASSAPSYDSSDPFAAWESASARVGARQSSTAKAMGVDTVASQPTQSRPAAAKSGVDAAKVATTQAKPTQTAAAPVEKATAPKASASADDDFDLDAILNEFK